MMEYGVVTARGKVELVKYVNEWIAGGWEPLGGISVSATLRDSYVDEYFLAQAMVRQKPESGPVIKAFVNGSWEAAE